MADDYVVKSNIKKLIRREGCNTSSDVIDKGALNSVVEDMVVKACSRAKENKRKTVFPRDL